MEKKLNMNKSVFISIIYVLIYYIIYITLKCYLQAIQTLWPLLSNLNCYCQCECETQISFKPTGVSLPSSDGISSPKSR